ncbi:MAG: phage portal protein [Nitrospinae bacterium]|nr:phage portal protein [Nitrospinota bacterium]
MINGLMRRLGYEKRMADSSYTDALVAAITANARGEQTAFPTATAALEACAGLVGRSFSAAEIKNAPDHVGEALTPDVLNMIGRSLIRKGEIIFGIEIMGGQVKLWPAAFHDVDGEHDPASWRYRLNLAGPDFQHTWNMTPADMVAHFQYARDPETPWRGVGPLQVAQLAGRLSAETAAALADESGGPRGSFMPTVKDGKDPTQAKLRGDVKVAKGSMLFVETMAAALMGGTAPPSGDWMQKRFGAAPPDALVNLLTKAGHEVMAACGLNPSLFTNEGETAAREAWRQALFGTIAPLGRIVETELRRKLDAPDLKLDWKELRASDLQARARSFKSMVDGGKSADEAAALSGLLLDEEG